MLYAVTKYLLALLHYDEMRTRCIQVHTCNPSYIWGSKYMEYGPRPALGKKVRPYLKKISQKGAADVAQAVEHLLIIAQGP
jgi:hypothetical protein